jgi:pimeloyl-ACP methyl ester carboxylesterase
MAIDTFNNVRLRYELTSDGDVPLVLVHGSWGSHQQWVSVASSLSQSFRVLSYDRRGHSESERPTGQGSVREDVADLIALIETLGLAPAWVAGNSFGSRFGWRSSVPISFEGSFAMSRRCSHSSQMTPPLHRL